MFKKMLFIVFRVFKHIIPGLFCFRKCALISAHYSLSDVFDNLVISLCKFTTLLIPPEVSGDTAIHYQYMLLKYLCYLKEFVFILYLNDVKILATSQVNNSLL